MAESFTTRLIQHLQIEQKKNDHGGVYAFAQRTLAYHSNRIEGSTLTEKQTASLFDTGTLTSEDVHARMTALLDEYNAKDQQDLHGLAKFHADYEAIHPFQDGNVPSRYQQQIAA